MEKVISIKLFETVIFSLWDADQKFPSTIQRTASYKQILL